MAAPASLFGRLLLLFALVPVAELVLLVWIGERVGLGPTLLLIVVTALAGSWLAHREGLAVFRALQGKLRSGQVPGRELVDGALVLGSGLLLLTPGVLTDVAGFLGLFPPSRAVLRGLLQRRFQAWVQSGAVRVVRPGAPFGAGPPGFGAPAAGPRPVEDAEVEELPAPPR